MLILSSQNVVTNKYSYHKGFTLIELIIVVMIISMVAFMVFSEAVKETKRPDELDPLTLSSTLRENFQSDEDIEFFCIKDGKDCYIAKGAEITPYKGLVDLGTHLEVYVVDKNNQLTQIKDFGRIKDHKISIRFTLYSNGSTTQMIISNDSGVYYLPTYFGEAKKVEDLDEAKKLWIKEEYNLRDSGNYY